jgi:hypothetical protein
LGGRWRLGREGRRVVAQSIALVPTGR